MNAALNYELAGYQANAACIAKQISHDITDSQIVEMASLFLQRRFLKLLDISKRIQTEPTMDGWPLFRIIVTMGIALSGKAFFHAVQFFLSGNRLALEEANKAFKDSEFLFSSLGLVEESNLVRGVRNLFPVVNNRATWTILPKFVPLSPKWIRYLKLLARGTGPDLYAGRSISELWPSQITALEKGLLSFKTNKIVKMPSLSLPS